MPTASDIIAHGPLKSPNVDGPSPTGGISDAGQGNATPVDGHKVVLSISTDQIKSGPGE